MSLHNLVAHGGKVIVLGGYDKDWPDFRSHPQLEFWSGENAYEIGRILKQHNNKLPDNAKAVVISRFVSHAQLKIVMKEARKRQLTVFPNKNSGEVKRILSEIINGGEKKPVDTPPRLIKKLPEPEYVQQPILIPVSEATAEPTEIRTVEVKADSKAIAKPITGHARPGSVKSLVIEYDQPELTPKESARIIFNIAVDKKITTTLNSLDQTIRQTRKTKGTFIPQRVEKAPAFHRAIEKKVEVKVDNRDNLVRAFDDAIAALQLARELAVKQQAENNELREYRLKMQQRLKALLGSEVER